LATVASYMAVAVATRTVCHDDRWADPRRGLQHEIRHKLWWLATGGSTTNPSNGGSVVKLI
jgi:hypothetical protein